MSFFIHGEVAAREGAWILQETERKIAGLDRSKASWGVQMSNGKLLYVFGAFALVTLSTPSKGQDSAVTLSLMCPGEGAVTVDASSTATVKNNNDITDRATVEIPGKRQVPFKATMYIEINGASGRMQPPKQLDSFLSNSKDGWLDIQNLAVAEREITGQIRYNMFTRPKFKVDRMSGMVTLGDERNGFTGQCERMENAKPKF